MRATDWWLAMPVVCILASGVLLMLATRIATRARRDLTQRVLDSMEGHAAAPWAPRFTGMYGDVRMIWGLHSHSRMAGPSTVPERCRCGAIGADTQGGVHQWFMPEQALYKAQLAIVEQVRYALGVPQLASLAFVESVRALANDEPTNGVVGGYTAAELSGGGGWAEAVMLPGAGGGGGIGGFGPLDESTDPG